MLAFGAGAPWRGRASNPLRNEDIMKNVTLLLTENVANLGIVGDVVDVRPGYARNYLLPRDLATVPSEANVRRLQARRQQVQEELAREREQMAQMFERLDGFELTIKRSANEQGVLYGSVAQRDIAEALEAEGYAVPDRAVRIGERIERLDSFRIPLELDELTAEIKLWVVSDKPLEALETGEEEAEAPEADAAEPAPEA